MIRHLTRLIWNRRRSHALQDGSPPARRPPSRGKLERNQGSLVAPCQTLWVEREYGIILITVLRPAFCSSQLGREAPRSRKPNHPHRPSTILAFGAGP